jgi:multidrug transporter EmrE-like cation transporter
VNAPAPPSAAPLPTHKKGEPMNLVLILISVCLAGVAQVTLKVGVDRATKAGGGGHIAIGAGGLKDLALSPVVWGGLAVFGISAIVWLFALSRVDLSFAYPFAALGYVIIVLASLTVLHESVPPLRWAGVALIITGIILVARTA